MKKCCVFILLIPVFATAQLQLAKIFSDNMVLQRGKPVHIWGSAAPGARIKASFSGISKTVTAGTTGSWHIYFKQQPACKQPQSIEVKAGNETILLQNILVGDIWLCIGQSNMEFPLQQELHYGEEQPQIMQPLVRFFNPVYIGKNHFGKRFTDSMLQRLNAQNFYDGQWQTCNSASAPIMSAIGYYFGKRISQSENIPVGLVQLSIGGCALETFISKEALANDKQFAVKISGNWMLNEALPVWIKQRAAENIGGGKIVRQGPAHAYQPGFAYSAGIEPMLGLPITGVLLYQGESNAQEKDRVTEYAALQRLLITTYRQKWKQAGMPFYWVQLSSIDTIGYASQLWPEFRNEQRKLLQQVKNSGMAVCSDLGAAANVHPTNKKEVAERLSRWALYATYHKNIVPSGPLPLNAVYKKDRVVISFQYAAGLHTGDAGPIKGFSADGKTGADAIIKNNKVLVRVKEKPLFIYYGWKPFTDANLVNAEKLPASTFKLKVQ